MAPAGLHEYEAWLDKLDLRLRIYQGSVLVEYDHPLEIPLHDCRSLEDIEKWAAVLSDVLSRNSTYLPKRYLIQRFIRLVSEQWKLSFNPNVVLERLDKHWGGYNEFTGDWNT